MHKSFLQTHDWLSFQKAVGREIWHFNDGMIEAGVVKHDLPFGKSYLYIPQGPVVRMKNRAEGFRNPLRDFGDNLKQLARNKGAIFVRMEPLYDVTIELMYAAGWHLRKTEDFQPSKTVIMDLTLGEGELLERMHHKLRYNIGLAERKGLTFGESKDVNAFWTLLAQTAEEDRFHTHPKKYYETMLRRLRPEHSHELEARLFFVYNAVTPIAGALVVRYGKLIYYLHGAMDRRAKHLMAPQLLHWKIMQFYKARGAALYDLWGIDARRWPGVTRFKLGFGGQTVEHPGTFDLPVSRMWYLAYRKAKSIF